MKTSTNKELNGWSKIYSPKNLKVNVREWLLDNGQDDEDAEIFDTNTTFADLKSCVTGKDEYGCNVLDYDNLGRFCAVQALDSFLRDLTFDALFSINK